jgi:hypothetical protein
VTLAPHRLAALAAAALACGSSAAATSTPTPDATAAATQTPAATPAPAASPTPAASPAAAATTPARVTGVSPPDDQARFLAGLPVPATSPLAALEATAEWKAHARAMDQAWARFSHRLETMDAWAKDELAPRIHGDAKLLYLFGGPDAVTPLRLFPDAPAYLLAGLEPVGRVPAPESLAPAARTRALSGLLAALRSVIPASFFRTNEMGQDLHGDAIDGVQPILYLFIARSGGTILAAERLELDAATGAERVLADGEKCGPGVPAVRVRFQREGHAPQEMTYARVDLSDDALERTPGFLAYARTFAPANAFLKAASFILHDNRFSKPRALLVEASATVLQDDSGLPYRAFAKDGWEFVPYGAYLTPKPPFQRAYQPELQKLFGAARPLPFMIGYRKGAKESNLLLAVKHGVTASR